MNSLIQDYISQFDKNIQDQCNLIHQTIMNQQPNLTQKIAWDMPTYSLGKTNIIHFSVHKNFISIHTGKDAIDLIKNQLTSYSNSTFHIPFDEAVPVELIKQVIKFNVNNA